jgi:hypothetical protein
MQQFVELNGRLASDRSAPVFDVLRSGRIIVYRDLPEIHSLCESMRVYGASACGNRPSEGIVEIFRTGAAPDIETYSAVYRTFRTLRNTRYVSCLFSDFIDGLDLPRPILVDAGYCRMVAPHLFVEATKRSDLFEPSEFVRRHPNEPERMLKGGSLWGRAHRDIDVRHSHFQVNLWFPLHDVDRERTLLLFPESYRRDVTQYGDLPNRDRPDEWGFGRALQIPLKIGDILLFHSQVLHASPSQVQNQDRFTVEIRVASACMDDNARIYRRLFWGLCNFMPGASSSCADAPRRAQQLIEAAPQKLDIDFVTSGETAHALANRLFRTPQASLNAAYVRRPDAHLDDAFLLDTSDWARVLKRLDELPCYDDLLLLIARLLLRQGEYTTGIALLRRICSRTSSYFWALEAGYFAVANNEPQLARIAFEGAGRLAAQSSV